MLLIRLALARLLGAEDDRQCVILDDPLVNTDRRRQRAALRTLQQVAQYTQISVFTCHPVAYEGVQRDVCIRPLMNSWRVACMLKRLQTTPCGCKEINIQYPARNIQ